MKEFLAVEAEEVAPQRLRRKALDLIDSLVAKLDEVNTKTIHDARRRLKELRAMTTLLGRGKAESRFFRDAGRLLSGARDAKAAFEAFERLRGRFASEWTPQQFAKIRRALAARVDVSIDPDVFDSLRSALIIKRSHVAALPVDEMHREDLMRALSKSYRRARRGMRRAMEDRSAVAIHEWRKRVKSHWFHSRFLTAVSLCNLETRNEALRQLSRALGDHHDLTLIEDICRRTPEVFGSSRYVRRFRTFVEREITELFVLAALAGSELFRERTRNWTAQREYARRAGTSRSVQIPARSKTAAVNFPP